MLLKLVISLLLSVCYAGIAHCDDINFEVSKAELQTAQENIIYISDALQSFRKLTEISDERNKSKVDNTAWDIQNLGFVNWTNSVKGSLLKQELEIATLKLNSLNNSNPAVQHSKAEKRVKVAKENFETFLSESIVME
jgi:hypothetical protein